MSEDLLVHKAFQDLRDFKGHRDQQALGDLKDLQDPVASTEHKDYQALKGLWVSMAPREHQDRLVLKGLEGLLDTMRHNRAEGFQGLVALPVHRVGLDLEI